MHGLYSIYTYILANATVTLDAADRGSVSTNV